MNSVAPELIEKGGDDQILLVLMWGWWRLNTAVQANSNVTASIVNGSAIIWCIECNLCAERLDRNTLSQVVPRREPNWAMIPRCTSVALLVSPRQTLKMELFHAKK